MPESVDAAAPNLRPGGALSGLLVAACCVLAVLMTVVSAARRVRFLAALRGVPGPRALPLVGNALQLTGTQADFFELLRGCASKYGPMFRLWIGTRPFIFLQSAEAVQPILNSGEHIDKSPDYKFVEAWIGQGLVTSTGVKWRNRRKLLTPSFHSRVLDDFLEPLQREALILADKMATHVGGPAFDMAPLSKLAALDVICDTALGKHVGAQRNANNAYVVAIERITAIVQRRFITPWLKPEVLFRLTQLGRQQKKCVQVIHGFTSRVYEARRQEKERQWAREAFPQTIFPTQMMTTANQSASSSAQPLQPPQPHCIPTSSSAKPTQRRLAMLDLLLDLKHHGADLSDDDIREEMDTFTFAGHDTTAAGLSWCLYVLGKHADVQERVVQEWRAAVQAADGDMSVRDLSRLDYLECCIKEVLRLYPVVPLLARDIRRPVRILGEHIPAGCTVLVNAFLLHRDPRFFPDPERFDPERFRGAGPRHPFAYVPFSAGSRNCIGQRFAMLELKVLLGTILDRFHVTSVDPESTLRLVAEIVLTNVDGIRLSLTPRA